MKLNDNSLDYLSMALEDRGKEMQDEDVELVESYIDIVLEHYPDMDKFLQTTDFLLLIARASGMGRWSGIKEVVFLLGMGLTAWAMEGIRDDRDVPERDQGDTWSDRAFTSVIGEERINQVKFGVQAYTTTK